MQSNFFDLDINGSKNMVSLECCTLAHLDNLCSSTAVPTCPCHCMCIRVGTNIKMSINIVLPM